MRVLLCATLLTHSIAAQVGIWAAAPATVMPPHQEQQLVFDPVRQVISMVGGQTIGNNSSPLALWDYVGGTWVDRTPSGAPVVEGVRATFHGGLGKVVALVERSQSFLELYAWTGSTWSLLPGAPPLLRTRFGFTYDAMRDRLVVFGGIRAGQVVSETWEWDGAVWQQLSSGGPPGRIDPAMQFDSVRHVCVLFGGNREPSTLNYGDTWEWNGFYWLEHFGIPGPSPRTRAMSTFDQDRGRMVLYGGVAAANPTDTWEWDGSVWAQMQTTMNPGHVIGAMAYDPTTASVLLLWQNGTWQYAPVPPAPSTFTAFGDGCGGTLGVPVLAAAGTSLPMLGTTFHAELTNIPGSVFNVPIGFAAFDATTWNGVPLPIPLDPLGFTGCEVWIAPAVSQPLPNNAGVAPWDIAIPLHFNLVGLDLYLQGAVLAPGANPGGFLFSNAGHVVVGTP